MTEDRDGQGRFTPKHTDSDVLAAVRSHEPAATSEVAGELGVSRQAADYRLRRLRESGRVSSKKIGASLVWFAPDPGDAESTDERPETSVERDTGAPAPADENTSPGHDTPPETDARDTVADRVDQLDLEGSGTTLEARKEALVEIVETLREHDTASPDELKALVDPDAVGYSDADSFWANMRRQDVFADLPVETPGRGGKRYRYQGPE